MPSADVASASTETGTEKTDEPNAPPQFPPTLRSQHIALINECIGLLHFLLTTHADMIDLRTKLSAINGCAHRYRVALTRLAFSEGSVFHQGIEEETVSKTFELLEEVVTPEEAEGLVQAFPGWNGRERKEDRSSGQTGDTRVDTGGKAADSDAAKGLRGGEGDKETGDDEEEMLKSTTR